MICGFYHDVIFADSLKIKGIEESRPLWIGEIHRNPATISLVKFFAYVIAVSIGFQRVAMFALGLIRKGAVDDSQFCISLGIFPHF